MKKEKEMKRKKNKFKNTSKEVLFFNVEDRKEKKRN